MTKLPTRAFNTSVRPPTGADENCAIDRATWTSMVTSARLPTGELDENRAIDCIAVLAPMVRHKLEKGYSREFLQTTLQERLREGRLDLTTYAVQAADAGDEICDAALRHVFVEIVRGELPERQPGHLHERLYGERAMLQPHKHKRRSGRPWHDDWLGNIQICMFIDFVCREFDVQPSRNRDRQRPDCTPSGISLVVAALARANIIYLEEGSVQENIWFGPPGELVRATLPAGNY
jgi:hypothetical protein